MSGETLIIEEVEPIQAARPVIEDTRARARRCPLRLYQDENGVWMVSGYVGHYVRASVYEVPLWQMLVEARKEIKILKARNTIYKKLLGSK